MDINKQYCNAIFNIKILHCIELLLVNFFQTETTIVLHDHSNVLENIFQNRNIIHNAIAQHINELLATKQV